MAQSSEHDREPTPDLGDEQVGQVYARALVGATEQVGATDAVVDELDALVREVLNTQPRLSALLTSELVDSDAKEQMLEQGLRGRVSTQLLNFLKVLARHSRFNEIRAVRDAALDLRDELRGRVGVQVTTAVPLDPPELESLVGKLRSLVGGEPRLEPSVDPTILGGVIVRVGDTVYDGSVVHQLSRLREQMINRSVHEIQRGRDRFGLAEGN